MGTARTGRSRQGHTAARRLSAGFTTLELVAVLLVVGLLAVTALTNLSRTGAGAVAEADALRTVLRYAQSRAMADVYTWGVAISSSGYTLFSDNPSQSAARLPGQESNLYNVATGVTLSGATPIRFDWRGIPVSTNVTTPGSSGTAVTSNQYINVTESSQVRTITVTPYTGFVP